MCPTWPRLPCSYVVNPDDPNTPLIKPVGNIPKGEARRVHARTAGRGVQAPRLARSTRHSLRGPRQAPSGNAPAPQAGGPCTAQPSPAAHSGDFLPSQRPLALSHLTDRYPPNRPAGLPPVTVHYWFPLYEVGSIISLALLICMIDLCESVSIAKSLAQASGSSGLLWLVACQLCPITGVLGQTVKKQS